MPGGARGASAINIGVDGGVDFKTAAECAHVGADTFISGTTLFGRPSLGAAVKKMRKIVEAAGLKASELEPQLERSASRPSIGNYFDTSSPVKQAVESANPPLSSCAAGSGSGCQNFLRNSSARIH